MKKTGLARWVNEWIGHANISESSAKRCRLNQVGAAKFCPMRQV